MKIKLKIYKNIYFLIIFFSKKKYINYIYKSLNLNFKK